MLQLNQSPKQNNLFIVDSPQHLFQKLKMISETEQ